LGGTANWTVTTVSGSLTLGGTVTARAAVTASGSLSLGGTVVAAAATTAAGSITLGGTSVWVVPTVTGSIVLSGGATARAPATAAGSISLGGNANWVVPSASGSLSLAGSVTAQAPATASGSITLGGTVTASAAVVDGSNLLPVPTQGIESSPAGWPNWSECVASRSTDFAHTGSWSLKIVSSAGRTADYYYVDQTYYRQQVRPGETYRAEMWSRAASTGRVISIDILWWDANNAYVDEEMVGTQTDTSSGWTLHSGTAVAPAGAVKSSLRIFINDATRVADDTHYFDDFYFGNVVAGATGSITLGGSSTAQAPVAATGSISLSGSVTGQATTTATGSITLSGAATTTGPAVSGSITLTGAALGQAAPTATGSITLTGSLAVSVSITASGSITLGGFANVVGAGPYTGTLGAKSELSPDRTNAGITRTRSGSTLTKRRSSSPTNGGHTRSILP
jgi:hypothetical protein